ncbi:DUF2079 domain-containing protein [Actinomadura atramentaria]|uniref:DUF2079 domain-containing protein n=1 Tax=Actinomadura atramentaria TaxID=1990 RepID=UPI0003810A23|nr:DUF2079 domain-containing protein [Actinomadura atramentaria]
MADAVAMEGRPPARAARRPRRSPRRPPGPLAALVVATGTVYTVLALLRLRTFRTSTYDLVIFDQAVRSYSRFGAPIAPVKGVHNGFGADFSILGDHFSPLLAVLAPFYRLHDGPATLLVAQAVLFALAIVPVHRFAARRVGRRAAYAVAAAYALSWPIAEALAFDFHEVAFVPPLSAYLVERWDAGRRGRACVAALLLLLVKEDTGLLLVGFGLYLLTRRGERWAGAAFAAAGLAATWIASRVVIAEFGGDTRYYWAYGRLGADVPDVAAHLAARPWDALAALGTPPEKLLTALLLVAPFLLLPLLSPVTLVAVPMLAERMLADRFENWWAPHYHYNAFVVAVIALATADGASRLRALATRARRAHPARARPGGVRTRSARSGGVWSGGAQSGGARSKGLRSKGAQSQGTRSQGTRSQGARSEGGQFGRAPSERARGGRGRTRSARVGRVWSGFGTPHRVGVLVRRPGALLGVGLLVGAVVQVPFFAFRRLAEPGLYVRDARASAAARAVARVPDGAVVEAANHVGPALTGRARVLLWDGVPRRAAWVVADGDAREFPFPSAAAQRDRIARLLRAGYREVYRSHGYVVLHGDAAAEDRLATGKEVPTHSASPVR